MISMAFELAAYCTKYVCVGVWSFGQEILSTFLELEEVSYCFRSTRFLSMPLLFPFPYLLLCRSNKSLHFQRFRKRELPLLS